MNNHFRIALRALVLVCAAVALPAQANDAGQGTDLTAFSDSSTELLGPGYKIVPARKVWYKHTEPPDDGQVTPDISFHGNNPATLYGGIEIYREKSDKFADTWVLDGDDVIAIYGYTPPPISYYSFVMNERSQYYEELGSYAETNSSIGLAVNLENIATENGEQFDDFFVLIITARYGAGEKVRKWFIKRGAPEHAINFMYLPDRFTKQAEGKPHVLIFLSRLTFRTDEEHRATFDYAARTPDPIKALFFDGPGKVGDVDESDLTKWSETLRDDTSEFDAGVDVQLDTLVSKVRAHYESQGLVLERSGSEDMLHFYPELFCRDKAITCNYDTPDALYGRFDCAAAPRASDCSDTLDFDDLVVIVGVDHHRFGNDELVNYFSYSATREVDIRGVSTVLDVKGVGTADPFLAGDPELDPDDFFVFTVSRDCAGDEACLEVPLPDNPDGLPGIPLNGKLFVSSRWYLDKVSASGPNADNFVPAQLLWFKQPTSAR